MKNELLSLEIMGKRCRSCGESIWRTGVVRGIIANISISVLIAVLKVDPNSIKDLRSGADRIHE